MKRKPSLVFLVVLALLVGACGAPVPPTSSLAATPTIAITTAPTASPSATPTPGPTETPTPTVAPSLTPVPTATPVPSPSAYPTGSLPAGTSYVRYGSRAYPVIAITVDDCYSSAAVAADLAVFQKYHVNATWFPIGYVAALYPDLWRAVDAAGFPIANHTFDHQNLTLKTYDQIVKDFKDDNNTLSSIIGHPIMPFARPYGGSLNDTVIRAAAAAGEKAVINWDTTDGDTSGGVAGYTDVNRLISLGEGGKNGSIILMHANHEYTTKALPAIINYYRARGFQFVTLGQMFGVPGPVPYGPEPATWIPTPSPSPTLAPPTPPYY